MGIDGHMLGSEKLKRLSTLTSLLLSCAYIRNGFSEGVVIEDGKCKHYRIDPRSGKSERITDVWHWTSCPIVSRNG